MVMRKTLLLGFGALCALAPVLSATVVFVPIPSGGTASKASFQTTVEVANNSGANGQVNIAFVPTGTSGVSAVGGGIGFANGHTVTYDATHLIGTSGLLKLTSNATGLAVGQAAFYVNKQSENAPWDLPVISAANEFNPTGNAFIEDVNRNVGGVTNVEIVNAGSTASLCHIALYDPKGVAILPVLDVTVPAQGHVISADVLGASHITDLFGGEARVSCDQLFYAYGTFVSPDFSQFRIMPPLTTPLVPAGVAAVLNKPGTFFAANAAVGSLNVALPLVPGTAYRRVTVDFDMTIRDFSPLFTGVIGMFHSGGPRFGKTLYYGFNIRGSRGRVLGDLGQATLEAAVKRDVGFVAGGTYHMRIIYDTPAKAVLFYATKQNGTPVMDALVGNFNWDLRDSGSAPVRLQFGLPGVADHAYYPPAGWRFANLHVVATP